MQRAPRKAQGFGEKRNQFFIGSSIFRWRLDFDFEGFAVNTDNLIF